MRERCDDVTASGGERREGKKIGVSYPEMEGAAAAAGYGDETRDVRRALFEREGEKGEKTLLALERFRKVTLRGEKSMR